MSNNILPSPKASNIRLGNPRRNLFNTGRHNTYSDSFRTNTASTSTNVLGIDTLSTNPSTLRPEIFTTSDRQDLERQQTRIIRALIKERITGYTEYLQEIYLNLRGDLGKQAKRDYSVKDIFKKKRNITEDQVKIVRSTFINRQEEKDSEDNRSTVQSNIETLKKGEAESLRSYFQRALYLYQVARGEDLSNLLSLVVGTILEITVRNFRKGLDNPKLRKRLVGAIRTLDGEYKTLTRIYT